MARGIQIPFTLDVREWRRGMRMVELDLEDLGDEFRDLERDADRALEDIEDSFKEVGRAAERAGRDAKDGLGQGMREGPGARAAGGALAGEIFDEFIESWGEAVRSGDYGEAIRETFSNLGQIGGAVGGPVGAAAGAIGGLFLTNLYDKITADQQRAGQIRQAISDVFLGVKDDAAEAGSGSWIAYRDAVIAAAKSDEAIASALGVESFAEAMGLIEQVGEELGQTWENDVILALTDTGPAGEAAASRVEAAWKESNGRIKTLEAELADARSSGVEQVILDVQKRIKEEKDVNGELKRGVDWLKDQGVIADGLKTKAQEQYKRDRLVTEEKRDQATASRDTRDAVNGTKDKRLPGLKEDLRISADAAERAKKAIENMPTYKKVTVDVVENRSGTRTGRAIVE